jgi:hypothetical protein
MGGIEWMVNLNIIDELCQLFNLLLEITALPPPPARD